MPYIKQDQRPAIDREIEGLILHLSGLPETDLDGSLNYTITTLLHALYPPRYFNYNRAVGVLECAKLEFYRRIVGPYEDTKIAENGDVGAHELELGDRVELIPASQKDTSKVGYDCPRQPGGVVVSIPTIGSSIGVEFPVFDSYLHDLGGLVEEGHGYWIDRTLLRRV